MSDRFYIDENGFPVAEADSAKLPSLVDNFCDLLAAVRERGFSISRWSQFEYASVSETDSVVDLLYGNRLPKDIQRRFIEAVNRCPHWDDDFEEVIEEFEVSQTELTGITLAHAFDVALTDVAVCCVGLQWLFPCGWNEVCRLRDQATKRLEFRRDSADLYAFYRQLLAMENVDEDRFFDLCPVAFPNLIFAENLAKQVRRFQHRYEEVRSLLVRHLSALNDHFAESFRRHAGAPFETAREIEATTGVPISPESPQTHRNRSAMKQREIDFSGQTVVCQWHSKLFPNVDRIYFHPGSPAVADGKIIIGILSDHLAT